MLSRRDFLKLSFYGVGLAGFGKGVFNTRPDQMELVRVPVSLPNLPPDFRNLKIAQLSDLHSSLIVDGEHLTRAAELAMSGRPDVIVLTGDYLSGKTKFGSGDVGEFDADYLAACVEALAGLQAPMGIYAVLGNHDFWSGSDAVHKIVSEFESRLGVVWLRNRHVIWKRGGNQVALLGVDDYWENSCSLLKAHEGVDPKIPKILLSHNPDINESILPHLEVDLVLSGHTHGGQVVIPGIGMPFLPSPHGQKYRQGLVRDGRRQTYITRGVGHLVAPVRYNCPPEVTLIELV